MSPESRPGARVTVVPFGEILSQGCHQRHSMVGTPIGDRVGAVDRIDERIGDHRYVVVFPGVLTPIFSESWVECFAPSGLVVVEWLTSGWPATARPS